MNAKNAAQFVPLVQALADGKTIQFNRVSCITKQGWTDLDTPDFFHAPEFYRIKPEPPKPREWFIHVNKDRRSTETAKAYLVPQGYIPACYDEIKVREVLPEP